jgi:competence protein ComEA
VVGEGCRLHRVESAVVAALVLAASLGVWWWTSSSSGPDAVVEISQPASTVRLEDPPARIAVHVAGEVASPGVVLLAPGSRVVDAVQAAGGASPRAALSSLNLAAELVDGSQVLVPPLGSAPGSPAVDDGLIALNHADAGELESLPGVGPVLAARIVAHRTQHGQFLTVEDLLDVSGIGESILERLRPHVRVP